MSLAYNIFSCTFKKWWITLWIIVDTISPIFSFYKDEIIKLNIEAGKFLITINLIKHPVTTIIFLKLLRILNLTLKQQHRTLPINFLPKNNLISNISHISRTNPITTNPITFLYLIYVGLALTLISKLMFRLMLILVMGTV